MKTISVYKLNFRKSVEAKIVCNGFGISHIHYLYYLSLVELSTSISTLVTFGFNSIKMYIKDANGEYNTEVEL